MCGRFVTTSAVADLAERLHIDEVRDVEDVPNYNVTPRTEVLVVAQTANHARVLDRVRWGLVPSWAKDVKVGDKLINARAETISEKPAYKRAFAQRRCLIPVDGFYEWKVIPGRKTKQPVFIHSTTPAAPLVFAGIYEVWKDRNDPDAPWLRSCSIVTTAANDTMRAVHNRMPVILGESVWDEWLDVDLHDTERLQRLLVPAPNDAVTFYPIRTLVNRPANNGPELLEPVPFETLDGVEDVDDDATA
jgi:putative SOS response-associated peptidase YedK